MARKRDERHSERVKARDFNGKFFFLLREQTSATIVNTCLAHEVSKYYYLVAKQLALKILESVQEIFKKEFF